MGDHSHDHHHDHHDSPPRVSSPEERELLKPFVDELHAFLVSALTGVEGPIAEIGAGDGIIADRLRADGFDVVAIDAHEATAAAATDQGRRVDHADWLTWDGDGSAPFAALIFTRSLHHIEPLDIAAQQMARLAPGGLLIADEFGFERVGAAGAQFMMDATSLLDAVGIRGGDQVVVDDPLAAWQKRMTVDHEVASGDALISAIESVAKIESVEHGSCMAQLALWRVDAAHPNAVAVRDFLRETERARTEAGVMEKMGLRIVARLDG